MESPPQDANSTPKSRGTLSSRGLARKTTKKDITTSNKKTRPPTLVIPIEHNDCNPETPQRGTFTITQPPISQLLETEYEDKQSPKVSKTSQRPKTATPKRRKNSSQQFSFEQSFFMRRGHDVTDTERRQSTPTMTKREFQMKILSDPKPKLARFNSRSRSYHQTLTKEDVQKKAQILLSGRQLSFSDPGEIADIIDELTNIQIESLSNNDYKTSHVSKEVITQLRTQFRLRDREDFHRDRISYLSDRLHIAKTNLKKNDNNFKERIKELSQQHKEESEELRLQFQREHEELEEEWNSDKKARQFSKKSATLLQYQTIEKHLALIGDYESASHWHQSNAALERKEMQSRSNEFRISFEQARSNLLKEQEQRSENQLSQQKNQMDNLCIEAEKSHDKYEKIVNAIDSILKDEKDPKKFFSKAFRKPPDQVLPMSASVYGGEDVPAVGPTEATEYSAKRNEYRGKTVACPLALPPLKYQKYKVPKTRPSTPPPHLDEEV